MKRKDLRRYTPEQTKAMRLKWPKRFILYRVRGNAKARGLECTITEADLPEIPEFCPVFPWIKLVYDVGKGRCDGSLSVDRIDSTKGYIKGNIRFISHRANTLKNNATLAELVMLGLDANKLQLDAYNEELDRKD